MDFEHEALSEEILVTGTTQVHRGPSILHGILLSADGGAAEADLYDGMSIKMERKFHLEALSGTTFGWRSTDGIKLHSGIHIVTTATNGIVMVEYHPLRIDTKGKIIKET